MPQLNWLKEPSTTYCCTCNPTIHFGEYKASILCRLTRGKQMERVVGSSLNMFKKASISHSSETRLVLEWEKKQKGENSVTQYPSLLIHPIISGKFFTNAYYWQPSDLQGCSLCLTIHTWKVNTIICIFYMKWPKEEVVMPLMRLPISWGAP